jgi:hypothetical protein
MRTVSSSLNLNLNLRLLQTGETSETDKGSRSEV